MKSRRRERRIKTRTLRVGKSEKQKKKKKTKDKRGPTSAMCGPEQASYDDRFGAVAVLSPAASPVLPAAPAASVAPTAFAGSLVFFNALDHHCPVATHVRLSPSGPWPTAHERLSLSIQWVSGLGLSCGPPPSSSSRANGQQLWPCRLGRAGALGPASQPLVEPATRPAPQSADAAPLSAQRAAPPARRPRPARQPGHHRAHCHRLLRGCRRQGRRRAGCSRDSTAAGRGHCRVQLHVAVSQCGSVGRVWC